MRAKQDLAEAKDARQTAALCRPLVMPLVKIAAPAAPSIASPCMAGIAAAAIWKRIIALLTKPAAQIPPVSPSRPGSLPSSLGSVSTAAVEISPAARTIQCRESRAANIAHSPRDTADAAEKALPERAAERPLEAGPLRVPAEAGVHGQGQVVLDLPAQFPDRPDFRRSFQGAKGIVQSNDRQLAPDPDHELFLLQADRRI